MNTFKNPNTGKVIKFQNDKNKVLSDKINHLNKSLSWKATISLIDSEAAF